MRGRITQGSTIRRSRSRINIKSIQKAIVRARADLKT